MKLEKRTMEYAGICNPLTPAEIRIEILGLKNLVKQAEEWISRYEQALEIAMLVERIPMEAQRYDSTGEIDSRTPEETQGKSDCPPLVR